MSDQRPSRMEERLLSEVDIVDLEAKLDDLSESIARIESKLDVIIAK